MRYRALLYVMVLIIMSGLVSGHAYTTGNLYEFETDGIDTGIAGDENNLKLINTPAFGVAKIDNGMDLDKASIEYAHNDSLVDADDIRTIELWINSDLASTTQTIVEISDGDADDRIWLYLRANDQWGFRLTRGGIDDFDIMGGTYVVGQWYHVVATLGTGGVFLWVNGTQIGTDADTNVPTAAFTYLKIGYDVEGDTQSFDGKIDNLVIWDDEFDLADAQYGYNSFTGRDYGVAAGTVVVVNLISPANDTIFNSGLHNFTFNYTVTNESLATNCELWTNETGTWAFEENKTVDLSVNTTLNITHTIGIDGDFIWNVGCNVTGLNSTFSTNNFTILIDTANPVIITDKTKFNKTFVFDLIEGQINVTDQNLYSFLGMINSTVDVNITDLNQTFYYWNFSINASGFPTGVYEINATVCDGHTSVELKDDWDYKIGMSGLEFRDGLKWYRINPTNSDWFEDISTTRYKDRYDFKYKKSWMGKMFGEKTEYKFIVESSDDIVIRYNSRYNAHMVIPTIGRHGRWIDFNLENSFAKTTLYKVRRINSKAVEVTISNIPKGTEELIFKSTGELNCIQEVYNFYKYTTNHTFDVNVAETTNQIFTLNISRNSSYITSGSAVLYHNNSIYASQAMIVNAEDLFLSKTLTMPNVTTHANVSWYWNYTLVGNITRANVTDNETQQILNINFDDCSTYTIPTLNFTAREEINNNTINATMDFFFTLSNGGLLFNYSKEIYNHSTKFCISDSTINLTAELQTEYLADGFELHTYYMSGNFIDNTTEYVTLYLQNGTTTVTFTVQDQSGEPISGAFIKVLKWDVGKGLFTPVSILKTDSLGKAIGQIVLDTVWYQFLIELDGDVVLIDGPTILTTTTRTFTISFGEDYFDRFNNIIGIAGDVDFSNATKNFSFTFSDTSGETVTGCLKVINRTVTGDAVIGTVCADLTATTLYQSIGIDTNESIFIGTGYIIDSEGDQQILDVHSVTLDHQWEKWGTDAVWLTFLIVLTITMVGLFHPSAAIVLSVVGLVIVNLMGLYHLSFGILITIVIFGIFAAYKTSRD